MKAKDIFQYALAGVFVLASFVLFYLLKDTESETVQGIMEILKMGVVLILGFFFGSSKGSSEKTDIISKLPAISKDLD
jgi:hypothetical protein